MLRIAASRGFSELTKSVIRSSHGHSTPSLKISCKLVQFAHNVADKETSIAALHVSLNWPKIKSGLPMVIPHLPWKFHANRSSRFLVIFLTKKQRKKDTYIHTNTEIDRKQYPVPRCIGDVVIRQRQKHFCLILVLSQLCGQLNTREWKRHCCEL